MQKFIRNLLTEWRKLNLPFEDEIIVAAVSGGADSVSLLLALYELKKLGKLNLRVVVAHFNHNLRGGESDVDEQFVKSLAVKFDFELACGSGEIAAKSGNVEQNARDARYKFLAAVAENLEAYAVLTAHTLNDQAETLLFNLIRGSGIEGLGGMKPQSSLKWRLESAKKVEKSEIRLIRPLLSWARREDTENFCHLNQIEFRYDSMNEDLKFNRVRIRKILLPLLRDFNPKIIETLAKTAELLREDAIQLAVGNRQSAVEKAVTAADGNENLSLKDLREVFPSIRRTLLRDWLKANRGTLRGLEMKHFEAIERLIFSRKSGRLVELPGGESVLKKDGKIYYQKS